ncbi:hypothetical protein CYY_008730 [Polysphondylium violaceum]|uniref:Ubiquitin-like protease family profile domain-containing protein n=1 Tax=Polysphondylium violaceum TaxID=133409 RepID=A0A8J4PMP8_9MYCE|nr:hypothetical protein CYY_008730 [Polysphondylium violaceum]
MTSKDNIVISFKDATLFDSDLWILKRPNEWINDSIISFYLEYLDDQVVGKHCKEDVLLASPSAIYMCNFIETQQEIQEMFKPLKMESKKLIFFPINNNSDPTIIAGGSHWSLLVFIKPLNQFHYFDSMGTSNYSEAKKVSSKFSFLISGSNSKVHIEKTPAQQNNYDCGLYVLSIIEFLVNQYIKYDDQDIFIKEFSNQINRDLFQSITPTLVKEKRNDILSIIEKLKLQK